MNYNWYIATRYSSCKPSITLRAGEFQKPRTSICTSSPIDFNLWTHKSNYRSVSSSNIHTLIPPANRQLVVNRAIVHRFPPNIYTRASLNWYNKYIIESLASGRASTIIARGCRRAHETIYPQKAYYRVEMGVQINDLGTHYSGYIVARIWDCRAKDICAH